MYDSGFEILGGIVLVFIGFIIMGVLLVMFLSQNSCL